MVESVEATSALNMIPTYAAAGIPPTWDGALTDDQAGAASTLLWTCGHAHENRYGAMGCATEELLRRLLAEDYEAEKTNSTEGSES